MVPRLRHDQVDVDFAPSLREHVSRVEVGQEAILFEDGVGTLHRLNVTAAAVCALFDGRATLRELIEDVVAVFDGDPAQVEVDILTMTRELGRKGLLAGVRSEVESVDR